MLGHGSGFDSPGWNALRHVFPRLGQAFHTTRRAAGLSARRPLRPGARARGSLPARGGADRARRAGAALAPAPLPGGRARDRRQGRRDAGNAGRAARQARAEDVVPRALGGSQRAHRAVQGEQADVTPAATRRSPGSCRGSSASTPSIRRGTRRGGASILRDYLARNGIECELVAREPRAREPRRAHPRRRRAVARVPRRTPTRSSPTRRSGSAIRGRAISSTARCGGGARWT